MTAAKKKPAVAKPSPTAAAATKPPVKTPAAAKAKKPTASRKPATARKTTPSAVKRPARAPVGAVVRATRRELAAIKLLDPDLADSVLAALALALAAQIDRKNFGAAGQLRDTMRELRALAPQGTKEGDELAHIEKAREERLARLSAA